MTSECHPYGATRWVGQLSWGFTPGFQIAGFQPVVPRMTRRARHKKGCLTSPGFGFGSSNGNQSTYKTQRRRLEVLMCCSELCASAVKKEVGRK